VALNEVADVVMGQSPPGSSYNKDGEGLPSFQGKADFTRDIAKVRIYTTAGTKFASAGDVLMSVRAPVGPTNLCPSTAVIGRGLAGIRAKGGVDQNYLHWALRASVRQLEVLGAGTTFAAITGRQLRAHSVSLAPPVEQRRIVATLEKHLSRLDAADSSALQAARKLAAARHSAVGAVLDVPSRRRVPLRALISRIEAGRSFGGSARPATGDEWGIIKVSAMTWGEFRPTENKVIPIHAVDRRYEIKQGDLLVSRANTSAYVGASVLVGLMRSHLLLSDKSLRLVTRPGVDPRWLQTALSSRAVRSEIFRRATGTKDSMRNISQSNLLDVSVPDISQVEQARDVEQIGPMFTAIDRLSQSIGLMNTRSSALRQTLLEAAFSGRLTRS